MKVFYCAEGVADNADSFSPSAHKPRLLAEYLLVREPAVQLVRPEPATEAELARAHDPQYVAEILSGQEYNGFGNRSLAVAYSLPYTTGSFLIAARSALQERTIACSLSSGFHHAGYGHSGGFCTFNGLMVTALALKAEGLAQRVMILDCDYHYGDGTDHIIRNLGGLDWLHHETLGHQFHRASDAERYLDYLRRVRMDADIVLYQAGADLHVDDPLGGVLTTEQMRERDEIVFTRAVTAGIPVAWNLAGGYQRDPDGGISVVLGLHHNTYREALRALSR
jgi:acetoin utilization deacetylase AcuC-like enzyme